MKYILRPSNIILAFLFGLLTFITWDLPIEPWMKWAGHFAPMIVMFIGIIVIFVVLWIIIIFVVLWTIVRGIELFESYVKWYNKKYND